jgi:hypothetical protein
MDKPKRGQTEPTRNDACAPVARWENEGGACDERELSLLAAQMGTGEAMNEASSP